MKKSLVFALALMMVLAFATSAFAAQAIGDIVYDLGNTTLAGNSYYTYVPTIKTFTPDGTANYPYEIYLPNENPENYKIHSSYAKNTDACASCHSVHTAMNDMLLQWYTNYETCMACHDGTVSTTYDVARGITGEDVIGGIRVFAAGGMFGYSGEEVSLSKHNVTGEVTNAGAPGGGVVADSKGTWTSEFSCDACHDPHGTGGNARLLQGDANGTATAEAVRRNWYSTTSGVTPATNAALGLPATASGTVTTNIYKYGVQGSTISYEGKTYYTFAPVGKADQLVYNTGSAYVLKPGSDKGKPLTNFYVYNGSAWVKNSNIVLDNQTGVTRAIFTGDPADAPAFANVRAFGVPLIRVTMDIRNYLNKDGIAERVYHVSGINPFCGACHTDYNTASFEVYNLNNGSGLSSARKYDTGAYSKAHRHTVARSGSTAPGMAEGVEYPSIASGDYATTNLSCLGCHVAHGAGQEWWDRYLVDRQITGIAGDKWTSAETVEIAGSSALKRMPNMGVCMNCHDMQGNQAGYAANSNQSAFISSPGGPGPACAAGEGRGSPRR